MTKCKLKYDASKSWPDNLFTVHADLGSKGNP
jgi:hypothetical protein